MISIFIYSQCIHIRRGIRKYPKATFSINRDPQLYKNSCKDQRKNPGTRGFFFEFLLDTPEGPTGMLVFLIIYNILCVRRNGLFEIRIISRVEHISLKKKC